MVSLRKCNAAATAVGSILALLASTLAADEPRPSPQDWMTGFSEKWDERAWTSKFGFRRNGYMRPLNDKGWKLRMLTLRGLVSQGKEAVPTLLARLKAGHPAERILAAQALSYLAPQVPVPALLDAAKNDKEPAVRLYAVDALGMRGGTEFRIDWNALRTAERNRDVKKHIGYAIERMSAAVAPQVVEDLTNWNPETIDTAVVGKPAPDFELQSATGEKVRLSQFQGKKAVVLVFIYGDT